MALEAYLAGSCNVASSDARPMERPQLVSGRMSRTRVSSVQFGRGQLL
jgi:hypothetical protein